MKRKCRTIELKEVNQKLRTWQNGAIKRPVHYGLGQLSDNEGKLLCVIRGTQGIHRSGIPVDTVGEHIALCINEHNSLLSQLSEERDKVRRLTKALEHYADGDNWCEADWNNPRHLEIVYIGNRPDERRHGYDLAASALEKGEEN